MTRCAATRGREASAVSAASSTPRARRCAASSATSRRWPIWPRSVGSDEKRLSRTIVRINTIESTSPLATGEQFDESTLPPALVPAEPDAPDTAYEKTEVRDRVRTAIQSLPLARAQGDRPLLLRRSHDEADRRGDWCQRVARVTAACARDSPPA